MIRYIVITLLFLPAASAVQHMLPVVGVLHGARLLLVPLVFLCCAVTVDLPVMLLLAFVAGFLWDAQSVVLPPAEMPAIATPQLESLPFGASMLLFALSGALMQGVQPLFRRGNWQVSALLAGVVLFIHLAMEFAVLSFLRGGFYLPRATVLQMLLSAGITMLLSPVVFGLLFRIAAACDHPLHPAAGRRRTRVN